MAQPSVTVDLDVRRRFRPLEIVRDENGKPSSTRLLLIVATALFTMLTITDAYWEISVNPATYEILKVILAFGLGGQAARSTVKNWGES